MRLGKTHPRRNEVDLPDNQTHSIKVFQGLTYAFLIFIEYYGIMAVLKVNILHFYIETDILLILVIHFFLIRKSTWCL